MGTRQKVITPQECNVINSQRRFEIKHGIPAKVKKALSRRARRKAKQELKEKIK